MTTIEDIIKFMKEYELPPSWWKDDELLIPVSTIIPQLVLLQSSEVDVEKQVSSESDNIVTYWEQIKLIMDSIDDWDWWYCKRLDMPRQILIDILTKHLSTSNVKEVEQLPKKLSKLDMIAEQPTIQKELDDRDNDLCIIANTPKEWETRIALYMRIIEYLVKKWFLQTGEAHLTPNTTVPKDGEVKIWTKIWDNWVVKIISRLFTVSQENIENSNQNRREEVYVKFDWWSWDVSLNYIRQNCKILD